MPERYKGFFKTTIEGVEYELRKLDLAGCRVLKEKFGVKRIELDLEDPDHLAGILYLCLTTHGVDSATAMSQVGAIDVMSLGAQEDEEPAPEPVDEGIKGETPTVAAPASDEKRTAASKSAKTPKKRGPRASVSASA